MENQKIHKTSNFWFGFVTGAGATLAASFLLGTKKGRKFLKNILELSENFEENLAVIMEEVGEKLEEKGEKHPSLHLLLNKIKNRLTF